MYAYFRRHGHATICMPASWRSSTGDDPLDEVGGGGGSMSGLGGWVDEWFGVERWRAGIGKRTKQPTNQPADPNPS
jgi:hypothetical protein